MASKLGLKRMAETRREDRIGVVLNDNIVKVRSQRTFYSMESWISSYSLLKSQKELKAGSFIVRSVFQKNLSGSSMEYGWEGTKLEAKRLRRGGGGPTWDSGCRVGRYG